MFIGVSLTQRVDAKGQSITLPFATYDEAAGARGALCVQWLNLTISTLGLSVQCLQKPATQHLLYFV